MKYRIEQAVQRTCCTSHSYREQHIFMHRPLLLPSGFPTSLQHGHSAPATAQAGISKVSTQQDRLHTPGMSPAFATSDGRYQRLMCYTKQKALKSHYVLYKQQFMLRSKVRHTTVQNAVHPHSCISCETDKRGRWSSLHRPTSQQGGCWRCPLAGISSSVGGGSLKSLL
jgi:hypothetical protein